MRLHASLLLTVWYAPRRAFALLAHGPDAAPFLPVLALATLGSTLAFLGGRPEESVGIVGRIIYVGFLVAFPATVWLLIPVLNTLALSRVRRRLGSAGPTRLTVLAALTLASLPLYLEGGLMAYSPLPILSVSRLLPSASPGTATYFLTATLGITPGFLWALGLYRGALAEVLQLTRRQGLWIVGGLALLDRLVDGLIDWLFATGLAALLSHWGVDWSQ